MTLKRRYVAAVALLTIAGAWLTGCGTSVTPTPVESIIATPDETLAAISPQPTPDPSLDSGLPTPTSSDVAVVGGVLVRDGYPGDTKLQLARVIRSEDGTPLVASVGEKSSPTAVTDEHGRFAFTDVPPDTYGLVLVTPLGSVVFSDESGANLLFDVEAGEVLDIGEIHTDIAF